LTSLATTDPATLSWCSCTLWRLSVEEAGKHLGLSRPRPIGSGVRPRLLRCELAEVDEKS